MPPNPPTEDRTWKPIRPWRSRVQPISGSDVPEVPPVGGVVAANLADGRPVFVVYHEDGTLSVVDAFSTHVTYGIGKLVGWCSSSRTFEDPFHGSKWDEFGDYELGPAPTGLVTYQSFGGQGDQNQVRVDGMIPPHPRGFQTQPFQPAGPFCQSTSQMVLPGVLQDASSSPADVVAATPTGWVGVLGILLVTAGRPARLCAAVADGACTDAAPVSSVDVTGLISAYRSSGPPVTMKVRGSPRCRRARSCTLLACLGPHDHDAGRVNGHRNLGDGRPPGRVAQAATVGPRVPVRSDPPVLLLQLARLNGRDSGAGSGVEN